MYKQDRIAYDFFLAVFYDYTFYCYKRRTKLYKKNIACFIILQKKKNVFNFFIASYTNIIPFYFLQLIVECYKRPYMQTNQSRKYILDANVLVNAGLFKRVNGNFQKCDTRISLNI